MISSNTLTFIYLSTISRSPSLLFPATGEHPHLNGPGHRRAGGHHRADPEHP